MKTKFVSSSVLEVENLHGEESYPVSLMEIELPQVGGNNVKIKAYAVNQKFPVMVPNRNLIQESFAQLPNLEPKMKYEILQNAYEGETHIIIGQDNYWAMVDNSFGLENLISHENHKSASFEPNSIGVLVVICQIIQGGLRLCQSIPSNQ